MTLVNAPSVPCRYLSSQLGRRRAVARKRESNVNIKQ